MDAVKSYLAEQKALVEQELAQVLKPYNERAQIVYEAMDYSLLAGGKRLRPVLFLTVLRALGKEAAAYLPFACGLEMIHTYSLIHDDLPAMDNDDLRRGRPTNHKVFGENFAILAGDGLLTHSFAVMLGIKDRLPAEELPALLDAVQKVSLAAGLEGMLTGQVVDVAAEGKELTLEELQYIHKYKTGALFAAAIVAAGILAGADERQLAKLEEFADSFGMAFQIIDDILDVIGDEAEIGKPVGSDEKNNKSTYPSLLGLEGAKAAAKAATEKALAALVGLPGDFSMLSAITAYLLDRKY